MALSTYQKHVFLSLHGWRPRLGADFWEHPDGRRNITKWAVDSQRHLMCQQLLDALGWEKRLQPTQSSNYRKYQFRVEGRWVGPERALQLAIKAKTLPSVAGARLQAFPAPERSSGYQMVWCVYCVGFHYHGHGLGHRGAHCGEGPYWEHGYSLIAPDPELLQQLWLAVGRFADSERDSYPPTMLSLMAAVPLTGLRHALAARALKPDANLQVTLRFVEKYDGSYNMWDHIRDRLRTWHEDLLPLLPRAP